MTEQKKSEVNLLRIFFKELHSDPLFGFDLQSQLWVTLTLVKFNTNEFLKILIFRGWQAQRASRVPTGTVARVQNPISTNHNGLKIIRDFSKIVNIFELTLVRIRIIPSVVLFLLFPSDNKNRHDFSIADLAFSKERFQIQVLSTTT